VRHQPALRRFNVVQQWDYKTIVLTGGFMGRHKEELNRPALEKELDELGNQGFELCWVLPEQQLQKEKDGHVLIFKRPKP
jgi:Domain of unknown function (DUF4177)